MCYNNIQLQHEWQNFLSSAIQDKAPVWCIRARLRCWSTRHFKSYSCLQNKSCFHFFALFNICTFLHSLMSCGTRTHKHISFFISKNPYRPPQHSGHCFFAVACPLLLWKLEYPKKPIFCQILPNHSNFTSILRVTFCWLLWIGCTSVSRLFSTSPCWSSASSMFVPKVCFCRFFVINQFLVCKEKNHLSMEIQSIIINLLQLAAADRTPLFTTNNVASITEVSV